jgi:very-short-patch-repair endonuclease
MRTAICENCGKEFVPDKSTRRFCGRKCMGDSFKNPPKTCKSCGRVFSGSDKRKSFCNWQCYRDYHARTGKVGKICQVCGFPFTVKKYMKDTARFCSPKCRVKGLFKQTEKFCLVCGKSFFVKGNRIETAKFCSKQCEYNYERKTVPCSFCGKPITRSLSKFKENRKCYCSVKCISKAFDRKVPIACSTCGKTFLRIKSQVKTGNKKNYCSYKCKYEDTPLTFLMKKKTGHRTNIEQIVENFLVANKVAYEFEFRIGKYSTEFAVPTKMIAIECDGSYWHNKPGSPERDARRDAYLNSRGWTVVHLSDKCIKDGTFEERLSNILFVLYDVPQEHSQTT